MIELQQVRFQYPRSDFKLEVPSLSVAAGEFVAIVGPSGSGKTTLLNLIAGIHTPLTGEVIVNAQTVSRLSETRRRDFRIANIGMVFQQFELIGYLDGLANVLLPFAINRSLLLNQAVQRRAQKLTDAMGLAGKLRRRPAQLSQGEQQRVAICRALITQPKIILADEPTGNLDPKNKSLILELIFQEARRIGQTLVVVTHDMAILEGFDRVIDFEQWLAPTAAEAR